MGTLLAYLVPVLVSVAFFLALVTALTFVHATPLMVLMVVIGLSVMDTFAKRRRNRR